MLAVVRTTFQFPYYTYTVRFNENVDQIKFGKGFTFASQPSGPPQRSFKLRMEGLRWIRQASGGLDLQPSPALNLGRLVEFYKDVECWKPFIWVNPIDGPMLVRFARPLDIPYQIKGGGGVVEGFEIEFIEVTSAAGILLLPDLLEVLLFSELGVPLTRENNIPLRLEQ